MGKVKAHTKRKPLVRLDDSKSKLNINTKKEKKNPKAQQEQGSDYFDHRTGAVYSTRPEDTDVKLVEAKITNFLKQLGELSHPDQELEEYAAAPQGYLPANHPKHDQSLASSPPVSQGCTAGDMEAAVTVTTTSDIPVTFWQEVRDAKTNRTYYWNPRTSEVTWTLPDNAVITNEAEAKMPEDPELQDEQSALQNSLSEVYASYAKAYCGVDPTDKQDEPNGMMSQVASGESDCGSSGGKSSAQRKTKGKKVPLEEAATPQDSPSRSKKVPALSTPGSAKVGKTEPQMLRLQVSSASDELSRQLNYLHVSDDGLSQVQKLSIILETRLCDWKEGVLSSKYMLVKLKEMGDTLQEYVKSATPTGWVCSWDSATCRYYYKNQSTSDISWGYPSQSVGSPASSHGETDLCSTEPEVRESNGDEPAGAAAAVQDAESSADSGVDEKLDKQLLMSQAPPPPPLPVMSSELTISTDSLQDHSVPAPMDEVSAVLAPMDEVSAVPAPMDEVSAVPAPMDEVSAVLAPMDEVPTMPAPMEEVSAVPTPTDEASGSLQPSVTTDQTIFSSQDARPTDSSAYMSPPDSTEATPDKGHRELEGQEAVDQPKADLYAFLPPAANSAEKEAELPQVQPQSVEPLLQGTAKGVLCPPTVSPAEIEGASCETSAVAREDIGMSIDDEEARLRQKLLRRLKPSAVSTGEVQAETCEGLGMDKAEPISKSAGDVGDGIDKSNVSQAALDSPQATTDVDAQAKLDIKAEESERTEQVDIAQQSTGAGVEESGREASPVEVTSKEKESRESSKSKKRSRDYSDQSDSDTSRHRKSYSKKSRTRYDSDRSDYSGDDSRRRRSSRRHRSRSRSYDYYSDEDRHRSSRRYRSASSDDDSYYRRDSHRSSRRYDRYSDEYSDDDDRRSSHRSSRKHRSRSRSGDRKDSKSRKEKKKKKEKKRHRHDDDDRQRSSDKRHSKSSSSSSSRFKDKKPKDSPKPIPPPPEKTFVPAKFKPKGKVREEPEEEPPAYQQPVPTSQDVLTPQQVEMVKNIASATGMAYSYPPVMEMPADASTVPYIPPTQPPPMLAEPLPDQLVAEIVEPTPEVPVVTVDAVTPLPQVPVAAEEQQLMTTPAVSEPVVMDVQEPEEVDMEIEEDPSPVKDQECGEKQMAAADEESKALEAYKASVIESLSGTQQTTAGSVERSSPTQKEVENGGEKSQEVVGKSQEAIEKSHKEVAQDESVKEEQEAKKPSLENEPLPPGTLGLPSKVASSGPSGEETTSSGTQLEEDYKMPSDDEATPPASASDTATTVTTSSQDKPKDSPVTSSVTSVTVSAVPAPTSTVSSSTTTSSATSSAATSPTATTSTASSAVAIATAAPGDSTPPLPPVAASAAATSSMVATSVGGYSYSAPASSYTTSYNYQNDAAQQQAYAAAYAQSMYNPAMGGSYYPYQYTSGTYDHNQYAAAMNYYANAYQAAYNASAYQAYYQHQSGGNNNNNHQKK